MVVVANVVVPMYFLFLFFTSNDFLVQASQGHGYLKRGANETWLNAECIADRAWREVN